MKILIAGTGDTAVHLAKMLSREDQDVVVMGKEKEPLQELDARYNLLTHEGSPVRPSHLRAAGVAGCKLFVAVTPFENHNIVSAQLAKWLGAARTLARIDNAELLADDARARMSALGVDEMVYPELLAAQEIRQSLCHPWLRHLSASFWFDNGRSRENSGRRTGCGYTVARFRQDALRHSHLCY